MKLNVKQRGDHVATFRWIAVRWMETLARWVPTTPETEAKLAFGTHLWDMAQHADWLGQRTRELRLPLQHSRAPTPEFVAFLDELGATAATDRRVAAFYDVGLPGIERRLRAYVAAVDPLLDGPTVRIVERILFDLERVKREGAELRAELPAVASVDAGWLEAQRARDASLGDVVAPRPTEAVPA
jgi:hypothetical protein